MRMEGAAISRVLVRCLRGTISPKKAARLLWTLRDTVPGLVVGRGKLRASERQRIDRMHAEFIKIARRSAAQRLAWMRRKGDTVGLDRRLRGR